METVTMSMGSVTLARRAEDIFSAAGIRTRVRKLDIGESPRGCAWGIDLDERELGRAKGLLIRSGVPFESVWRNKG